MTLGAPTVNYQRMNLVTMPHGPQADDQIKAGALEILTAANNDKDLLSIAAPVRSLESLEATQVADSKEIPFPLNDLDAVIMNAPFTANENRSKKYSDEIRKQMQLHELEIKKQVEIMDSGTADVITANSIRTFFSPLADRLINRSSGTLAMVIPTTACTGTSGVAERKFLADRFHIETIVTSHDPRKPNFSENTAIHESLLICRRRTEGKHYKKNTTRFVSLRKMPSTTKEAIEIVNDIQNESSSQWFNSFEQSEQSIMLGDWRTCQFLDPELMSLMKIHDELPNIVRLRDRHQLGPDGRAVRGAFIPVEHQSEYKVFWSRSTEIHKTMESSPEQYVDEKNPKLAEKHKQRAGNILLATKFDTLSGRLLSIYSNTPSLGSMWTPVQHSSINQEQAKALCAWFNSSLGALGFFNSRGTKLTNPSFSQESLRDLPIPDFKETTPDHLAAAYEKIKQSEIMPWKHSANDDNRDILDQAAAETVEIDIQRIREIREKLSREPTISNVQATVNS